MWGAQRLGRFGATIVELTPARGWLMLAFAAFLFGRGRIREAYVELSTGRAATYDRDLTRRHATMRAASGRRESVTVPKLARIPASIHFKDITGDAAHPHNGCYARFWNVPAVHTAP